MFSTALAQQIVTSLDRQQPPPQSGRTPPGAPHLTHRARADRSRLRPVGRVADVPAGDDGAITPEPPEERPPRPGAQATRPGSRAQRSGSPRTRRPRRVVPRGRTPGLVPSARIDTEPKEHPPCRSPTASQPATRPLPPQVDLPAMERDVLAFWARERHLRAQPRADRRRRAVDVLRGPADRQRQARRPPRRGPRLQGRVPPVQDDAGLPRGPQGRLGLPRPAGRARGREGARLHRQGRHRGLRRRRVQRAGAASRCCGTSTSSRR